MRTRTVDLLLVVGAMVMCAPSAMPQEKTVTVGANGLWIIPFDRLGTRFLSVPGGSAYFSVKQGVPEWGGAFEYYKFTRVNPDARSLRRYVKVDTAANAPLIGFDIPIPALSMSLEVVGLAATADVYLLQEEMMDVRFGFGAGIYHWKFNRGSYYDTLKVQTSRGPLAGDILRVPALEQEDWSGGINTGVQANVRIVDPLWFQFRGGVRFLIGELWPTLALDLEQVSTMMMFELRAGFRVDL